MESIFQEAPPLPPEDQRLVKVYEEIGRPLDDLPYTEDFDRLYARLQEDGEQRSKHEIMRRLLNLRKAARLPRLGRAIPGPPRLDPAHEELLADLIPHFVGTIGQRDRLVFASEFDELVDQFNRRTGLALSPHDVWRLVARIAK